MKHDPLDHAPIVETWLKEPVWLPPSDTARLTQLVHQTPQQRHWWQRYTTGSPQAMFTAAKFAVASVILLAFGGFLLSAYLPPQGEGERLPAAATSSPAATASPSTEMPSAEPEAVELPDAPVAETPPEGALVMEPGTGETVGGFTQVGRLSTRIAPRYGELQDLQAVGDRLVARSVLRGTKETGGEVILHSTDALTWVPATLAGNEPEILDLAATSEGLLAAGSAMVDGERTARLWASADGVEWTAVPAPAGKRVNQIISTDAGSMAVRSGERIWVSDDGSEWTDHGKLGPFEILQGPNGILQWQGGGQDRQVPTVVIHQATLLSPLSEVILPESLRWKVAGLNEPYMDIDVFALDDSWVMVGSEHKAPDTISTSADGLDWQDVPRPPEMSEGAVRWMAHVGDQVQAFGTLIREDSSPSAIWTWRLGDEAAAAETLQGTGDEWMNAPVAWGDGYVATGYEQGQDQFLTVWLSGPDPAG
jgi:hypothetical protein